MIITIFALYTIFKLIQHAIKKDSEQIKAHTNMLYVFVLYLFSAYYFVQASFPFIENESIKGAVMRLSAYVPSLVLIFVFLFRARKQNLEIRFKIYETAKIVYLIQFALLGILPILIAFFLLFTKQ